MKYPLNGRKIFIYFALFFAVIFAVNAVMIYLAITTSSGISSTRAYETGLNYNKTLAQAEREKELGWTIQSAACGTQNCTYQLKLLDKNNQPLALADVLFEAVRQTKVGLDFRRQVKTDMQGQALIQVSFPAPGAWSVFLTAVKDGHTYSVQENWFLK